MWWHYSNIPILMLLARSSISQEVFRTPSLRMASSLQGRYRSTCISNTHVGLFYHAFAARFSVVSAFNKACPQWVAPWLVISNIFRGSEPHRLVMRSEKLIPSSSTHYAAKHQPGTVLRGPGYGDRQDGPCPKMMSLVKKTLGH